MGLNLSKTCEIALTKAVNALEEVYNENNAIFFSVSSVQKRRWTGRYPPKIIFY